MAESAFQLVPIGVGHFGQVKSKGVTQVMGTQRRETTFGVNLLSVMPPANLGKNQVNGLGRETTVLGPCGDALGTEKHRGHIRRGIKGPLALEVVGKGCPGIDGEKDGSFRLALPTDVRNACGSRLAQFLWMGRFNLIEVKAYQLFAAEARREQHIDNSTISPRTPMSLRFVLVLLATPLELMKMIEPITDIFEGTNLLLPQGTWL